MAWKFRPGGATESPQNSSIKDFSKNIFESIVREAIQNSLDNPMPGSAEPVKVAFEFDSVRKDDVPEYDDLLNRYKASKAFWEHDSSYKPIFDAVDQRLEDFLEEIPYLKISDYHTTGMSLLSTHGDSIRMSSYYAFTRGNNTVKSAKDAGGSEGQGKATFFAASALRTIFVHTISEKGSIYEGLTRMPTHTWSDGMDYALTGHLFQDIDKPEYELAPQLDLPFRRTDDENNIGSSISILGLWGYENATEKIIKSAINNFWMAIHDGDLTVQVGNEITICSDNLLDLIEKYLPERTESIHTKSDPTENGRARCYYETWTSMDDVTETYTESLELLGQCTLKISQHAEYPGKVEFFRKQKMLINRSGQNSYVAKGYCGVFICTDDLGNQLLRKMEGKTHTEWDPKLPMVEVDKKNGAKAIKNINLFIKNAWQSYRAKHYPDSVELQGLEGLSFGNKKRNTQKATTSKTSIRKSIAPKEQKKAEYEKTGVLKKTFNSTKEGGLWKYSLLLKSNDTKEINIKMLPSSDATRFSNEDYLEVINVTDGWVKNKNSISGRLAKGDNVVEFVLNMTERLALDFKFNTI